MGLPPSFASALVVSMIACGPAPEPAPAGARWCEEAHPARSRATPAGPAPTVEARPPDAGASSPTWGAPVPPNPAAVPADAPPASSGISPVAAAVPASTVPVPAEIDTCKAFTRSRSMLVRCRRDAECAAAMPRLLGPACEGHDLVHRCALPPYMPTPGGVPQAERVGSCVSGRSDCSRPYTVGPDGRKRYDPECM